MSDRLVRRRADADDRHAAQPATASQRIVAYLVDVAVVGTAVLGATRGQSLLHRLLAVLGVATGYHVLLEGATGQTAGKRAVGIGVTRPCDETVGFRAAWARTAWRAVDWLPFGYLLGLASIARSPRNRRFGDRAANTVVVRRQSAGATGDGNGGRRNRS